jgi:amidase
MSLTSRDMMIRISERMDTIGPLARTVKDAVYILQAIAGVDPNDNYTSAIPNGGKLPDYVAACNASTLRGARLGIPRNAIELGVTDSNFPEWNGFDEALGVLKKAGAVIVDNANFTAADEFFSSSTEMVVMNGDFMVNLTTYLAGLTHNRNDIRSLADVRNFTRSYPAENYPVRDTGVWDVALDMQPFNNTDPRFWEAYQDVEFFGGEGSLLDALERHDLDAIVLPTEFASPWAAVVGAPIVTVPLGFYPPNASIVLSSPNFDNLVQTGPNVP